MGLGHVIRSLALVEMLNENFECHFFIRNPLPSLKSKILSVCQSIIELPKTEDNESEAHMLVNRYFTGHEIVVLDGYHFKTEYQRIIKSKGCKLVCIDDIHAYHFMADAIINHSGGIYTDDYSAEPSTRFYLGMQYAILRPTFYEAAKSRNFDNKEDNIFICLGGADPDNMTISILQKLENAEVKEKCYIVIGIAYSHADQLYKVIEKSNLSICVLHNIDSHEMVKYMKKCKIAITSASTIAYEYASVGGELYLLPIAENQQKVYAYFVKEKIGFTIDHQFLSHSSSEINDMYQAQSNALDGKQQKRFLDIFNALIIKIRPAVPDDCLLYFQWANDPDIRTQSFNTTPILLEDHKQWFHNRIYSGKSMLFVCYIDEEPIGQIRFDLKDNHAIINYALDKHYRGKGLAHILLQKGLSELSEDMKTSFSIIGYVKASNIPSRKAFLRIGFQESISTEFPDSYKYTYL